MLLKRATCFVETYQQPARAFATTGSGTFEASSRTKAAFAAERVEFPLPSGCLTRDRLFACRGSSGSPGGSRSEGARRTLLADRLARLEQLLTSVDRRLRRRFSQPGAGPPAAAAASSSESESESESEDEAPASGSSEVARLRAELAAARERNAAAKRRAAEAAEVEALKEELAQLREQNQKRQKT